MKKTIIIISSLLLIIGGTIGYFMYSRHKHEQEVLQVYAAITIPDTADFNENELFLFSEIRNQMQEAKAYQDLETLKLIQSKFDNLTLKNTTRLADEKKAEIEKKEETQKKENAKKLSELKKQFDNASNFLNTKIGKDYFMPHVETEYYELRNMFNNNDNYEDILVKYNTFKELLWETKKEVCWNESNREFFHSLDDETFDNYCYFG